jgi:hypothetical protein
MVLMLCYVSHSVCSQVHAFSTQQRLLTDKERKVKDRLAISILVLTVILLAVWWTVNAYYQNSILMLTTVTLAANLTSILMSIVVISVLLYCKCLLNRALVVPINKYGNDKIISALLWLNVAILVN